MTWYVVNDYTPVGPVAAAAAPGSIGGGWIDVHGSYFSITAANGVVSSGSFPFAMLLRPTSENPSDYNQQQTLNFTTGTLLSGSTEPYMAFRVSSPGASVNCILVGLNINTSGSGINEYGVIAGSIGNPQGITFAALASNTAYVWTVSVTQTNSTTTTIVSTLYAADGVTVINTQTITDTKTALQNVTGQCGFLGTASVIPITRMRTYTDMVPVAATSYSVALSTNTGPVNQPYSGTIALTGGTTLTSSLVITLADTNGTFIGNPVIILNGSFSGTFTYTPTTVGTHSITATHSGGNSGMTDPAAITFTATAVGPTLLPSNPAVCTLSPLNWRPCSTTTGAMQAWNAGAYARFYIASGCSAGVSLLLDPASQGIYDYQVDNGPLATAIGSGVTGTGIITVAIPDNGPHTLTVRLFSLSIGVAGRWAGTGYFGILSVVLPTGGVAGNAIAPSKTLMVLGDSITEGYQANNGTDGNPYDYSYLVGEALALVGFDYSIIGCDSQGYTTPGVNGVPNVFVAGNDPQSAWDKIDSSYSRLTNGLFTTPPTIIFDLYGTNDARSGLTGAALQAVIVPFWQALRAAGPNALIIKCVPWGGYVRADIQAAYATYQAAFASVNGGRSDVGFILMDLQIDAKVNGTGPGCWALNGGELHPGVWGNANIAPMVAIQIMQAYANFLNPPNRWVHF
jgi:lysophospholipase L1-like esterase